MVSTQASSTSVTVKHSFLPAIFAVALIVGVEWHGSFNHVNQMIFSIILVLAAALGVYLLWLRKWDSYKQQQLEEQNLDLESKIEERTNDMKHQLYFTQRLLDAIPLPVFFKDVEGIYLGCNREYEVFRGIAKEDLFGKSVFDIVTPEVAEALNAMDVKLFSGAATQQYETSLLSKDGSRREVIYHKACFNGINNEPAGLICVIQDITSQKLAENSVKQQNEELEQRVLARTRSLEDTNYELIAINKELEERRHEAESIQRKLQQLSSAVVNSPVTVIITDCSGLIEYVNPKFTEITGYQPEEAIGRNPRILNAGVQSKDFYREMWDTLLAGCEWRGDFCNRKKNRDIHWEHASISPIRDEQGKITHFVAIKEDVTEQKLIAEELLDARNAADAANRSKSEFLANMSHEIRTPLSAIIGYSDLALRTDLQPRQYDYVQKIQSAGELLLNLVNDILDFSKIEASQLKMEQIRFNLDEAFAKIINTVQQKALDKGLSLRVKPTPKTLPCLIGDPHRLSQIVINLLSNAVKFTEHGEVSLETTLLTQNSDQLHLKISIHDTGIGISAEQIKKLFQPFMQADSSTTRRFGGTGLGLSISKQLVEMMGGEIWCESIPGQGSSFCFTVRFGICQENDTEYCASACLRNMGQDEAVLDFSGFRILLVDDNATNLHLSLEILKEAGAELHTAANGKEAVTMVTEGMPYDLVLMDIQMPIMDGYEATRLIRKDGRFTSLPIIAITAHAMQEEHQKIIQAGMDAHITKPIDARIMLRTMGIFLCKEDSNCRILEKVAGCIGDKPAIPDIAGFDVTGALDRLDGNRDLYLWVLSSFLENEANVAATIYEAIKAGDTGLALNLTHTIKSTAGSMGALELQALARSLENTIVSDESPAVIRAALKLLGAELDRIVTALQVNPPPAQYTGHGTPA